MIKSNPAMRRLSEKMVETGRKIGASQVEAWIAEGSEFSVDVRQGAIERLVGAGSKALSLKVIVDGKTATASSSDFSDATLKRLLENAVARARMASADPYAGLPEKPVSDVDAARLNLVDPAILELTPEAKINAAVETEKIGLADKRIRQSYGAGFSTGITTVYLANSNGFSGSYSRTACSCGLYLQAGEGENLFDEGWYDSASSLSKLMKPEAVAAKAVYRLTRLIGARKIESQNVPVVFEPPMTASLLEFLSECVNGDNIYMKRSFLAGRLGEKVGNDLVTAVDDGLMPGMPGTRPFDREGVPAQKTTVLEKGVLKNYLLDTYSGRKLGFKSNGHASGTSNFYLAAGTRTPEEIVRSVEKGLFLTGTIGFGQVATSGDISTGAFGLWIEKGEFAYPVAEITISGNLGQLLKDVEMVGNDLELRRRIAGPTIKVREMTVGGK